MKYVKINLTFGDKLKLLFFGLISEDKLPAKEVIKEVVTEKITENVVQSVSKDNPEDINIDKEEEFHVPFFELQNDDVKSNF